jgi:hypothetical protein
MSRKVSLPLLFLCYALVLVHSIMPHEHLHQETTAAKQHSHDSHPHSHEEEGNAAADKENPFSHYFHSLAQGEPHFPGKEGFSLLEALKAAKVEEQLFDFNHIAYCTVRSSKVYEADFHSPPGTHHFHRRGPPTASFIPS